MARSLSLSIAQLFVNVCLAYCPIRVSLIWLPSLYVVSAHWIHVNFAVVVQVWCVGVSALCALSPQPRQFCPSSCWRCKLRRAPKKVSLDLWLLSGHYTGQRMPIVEHAGLAPRLLLLPRWRGFRTCGIGETVPVIVHARAGARLLPQPSTSNGRLHRDAAWRCGRQEIGVGGWNLQPHACNQSHFSPYSKPTKTNEEVAPMIASILRATNPTQTHTHTTVPAPPDT